MRLVFFMASAISFVLVGCGHDTNPDRAVDANRASRIPNCDSVMAMAKGLTIDFHFGKLDAASAQKTALFERQSGAVQGWRAKDSSGQTILGVSMVDSKCNSHSAYAPEAPVSDAPVTPGQHTCDVAKAFYDAVRNATAGAESVTATPILTLDLEQGGNSAGTWLATKGDGSRSLGVIMIDANCITSGNLAGSLK